MKRLAYLIPEIYLAVAMLAAHSASAAVSAPSMVGPSMAAARPT